MNKVNEFEHRIKEFYGASYAIATDCCTHAIELCLRLSKHSFVTCPDHTYLSVPMTFEKLGLEWSFTNQQWEDYYYIGNTNIIDAAVYWKRNGYVPNTMMCLSFQFKKHLNVGRGDVSHAAANIGVEDRYTLQITGIDYAIADNWQNLHWFNFTDLPTKRETLKSVRTQKIDELLNGNNGTPYFVYFFNGRIADLEQIKHSVEVADRLNKTGVDIYLYEPLCSYDTRTTQYHPPMGNKMSMQFYSEFPNGVMEIGSDLGHLRADELDSIEMYVKNNDLTNVRVHTCDFEIERYYLGYENKFQLYTNDLFLKMFDLNEFEPLTDNEDTGQFNKKFICMNWRYTPHRQLLAAYLAGKDHTYLSWYFKSAIQNFMEEPWYNLKEWRDNDEIFYSILLKGVRYINDNGPLTLDFKVDEAVTIGHPYFKDIMPKPVDINVCKPQVGNIRMDLLKNIYNDVFCDIVTETRFAQPTANVSEKTFRAIFYKKPFIIAGPPHTLEYLQEMGFKTFSKWWDESYDRSTNHEERFFKIIGLISHIELMTTEELRNQYNEMREVVEHNRNVLLKKLNYKPRAE